jgi:glycoprotein endo-alpha-1,2-mannosidase
MRPLLLALLVALALPALGQASARSSIFFYPWYGTPKIDGSYRHWQQNGARPPRSIASAFYPARGLYSSTDRVVLGAQMREIRDAGVEQVAVSWWGRGSLEDGLLELVAAAAGAVGLDVAAHIEPYGGRDGVSVEADVAYLSGLGITNAYLYRPDERPASEWAVMNERLGSSARVFAQTGLVGLAAAGRFDGVYTYDVLVWNGGKLGRICAQARKAGLLCAPSVGPGYDARRAVGHTWVKPRLNGATYDSMWRAALRARADVVTITSYNEWHEGTQIEPARARPGYAAYEGAWGLRGAAAETAYLERTRYWTDRLGSRP